MIAIDRCIYAGYSSKDFNLIAGLVFDEDAGDTDTFLGREAVLSESHNGRFNRVHNYKYNNVLAPKLTFIKESYDAFTFEEQRKVLKWLTSRDVASFLAVYHDDSEVISYEILGGFIEINTYKNGTGAVIGVTATIESVAPWAFSALQTITKVVSNPIDNTITINLETDDVQNPVYPRITIQQDSTTNIIIINHEMTEVDEWVEGSVFQYGDTYYWVDADGTRHTSTEDASGFDTTSVSIKNTYVDIHNTVRVFNSLVKNNVIGETVVLDGANRVVSSSSPRTFGDDFSWNWIPLYDGKNELSFVGACTVIIEYRCPIKCGEF